MKQHELNNTAHQTHSRQPQLRFQSDDAKLRKSTRSTKRFKAGTQWTDAEVVSLVKLYPTHSNKDLAAIFGRSELAIIGKGRGLKLRKDSAGSSQRRQSCYGQPWSIEQEILLQELFPTTPNEETAEILDRSTNAVALRARRMGLRKMEFWTEQEDEQVKTLYTELSYEQLAQRTRRTTRAVQMRIITLGLKCKVENWSDQEIEFLKHAYPQQDLNAIALQLGRTPSAIGRKAALLQIRRNCPWVPSESDTRKQLPLQYKTKEITPKPVTSYHSPICQNRRSGLFNHIRGPKTLATSRGTQAMDLMSSGPFQFISDGNTAAGRKTSAPAI